MNFDIYLHFAGQQLFSSTERKFGGEKILFLFDFFFINDNNFSFFLFKFFLSEKIFQKDFSEPQKNFSAMLKLERKIL